MTDDPSDFAGMTDAQVIRLAATHLQNAARCRRGSRQQETEKAKFWAAYNEFGRREDMRVLKQIGMARRLAAI